jgi:hypothetical protein
MLKHIILLIHLDTTVEGNLPALYQYPQALSGRIHQCSLDVPVGALLQNPSMLCSKICLCSLIESTNDLTESARAP